MSLPAHSPGDGEPADPSALVGRVLDRRYRVTGLLGVGGIGRVYRAEHLVLKRPVAIKVLLEHYACVPDLQRRFEREAMALATLSHPNIVTITDFVASRDVTFLVMELLEGEELTALISRGPMAPRDALSVMEQMLGSLAYAHQRDVIHRDLKPQNVLVRRLPGGRMHAEILDFGLAKFMDGSGPGANLTKTGLIVGTPAYMAPEQASGARADQRADVYAAGLMLFEMLAGEHPFAGFEGTDLIRQHLLTPAPKLADRCPSARVAPELEAFLARALAKDGADRFADGGAMLDAFLALPADAFVQGEAKRARAAARGIAHEQTKPAVPAAVAASTASQKARARQTIALATIAVALVTIAVIAWTVWPPAPPNAEPEPREAPAIASDAIDEPVEAEAVEDVATDEVTEEEEAEALAEENDPTLDEEADAPIEDEEEAAEPEPPPPAQRPAARNPWAGRDPATLALVQRRLGRGQTITKRNMRQIVAYRRHHPSDVRPILLLARVYASRGWLSAALSQYRRAYRHDPSSRGDPRMLRELVRMAGTESLHEDATAALVEIYGAEARAALDGAIARERDEATRARLQDALDRASG